MNRNRSTVDLVLSAVDPDSGLREQAARDLPSREGLVAGIRSLLSWDATPAVRVAAAAGLEHRAKPFAYWHLARDQAVEARIGAAKSASEAGVLETLSRDIDPRVRAGVACNTSADGDTIMALAVDHDRDVRLEVARNWWATDDALARLTREGDHEIAEAASSSLERRHTVDFANYDVVGDRADFDAIQGDVSTLLALRSSNSRELIRAFRSLQTVTARLPYYGPMLHLRARLASQPWLGKGALRHLSRVGSPEVVRALASNTGAPGDVLSALAFGGSEAGEQAAANPSTPAYVVQAMLNEGYGVTAAQRLAAIANPRTPANLEDLARSASEDVRMAVARNPMVSPDLLARLANDNSFMVRRQVARHPCAPVDVLIALAGTDSRDGEHEHRSMWHALLRNPRASRQLHALLLDVRGARRDLAAARNLSSDVAAILASDPDPLVRRALVTNPDVPDHIIHHLLTDDEVRAAGRDPRMPVGLDRTSARHAAEEEGSDDRRLSPPQSAKEAAAVLFEALPTGDRHNFARATRSQFVAQVACADPASVVRAAAAANPATPELARASLVLDRDLTVRAAIASQSGDARVLADLALDRRGDLVAYCGHCERNSATPAHVLEELATHSRDRKHIAAHPQSSSALLAELASDSDAAVRLAVAANPIATAPVLAALASDTEPHVRMQVAANPSTSAATLQKLARDSESDVRMIVLLNRHSPSALSAELSQDPDRELRLVLARRHAVADEAWVHLVCDADPEVRDACLGGPAPRFHVRLTVARSEMTPPTTLDVLARDRDPRIRVAAASHPRTSPQTLRRLSVDMDVPVRLAVVGREDLPDSVLSLLVRDKDRRVRRAAKAARKQR